MNRKLDTKNCVVCNIVFKRPSYGITKQKWKDKRFCSQSCSKKGHKIRLGMKNKNSSNEKNRLSHLGRKYNPEWCRHISEALKGKPNDRMGELHPRWIKDRTLLKDDHRDRGGQLHKEWSKSVKSRDSLKCRIADENCKGRIEAHHILGWTEYPELRYKINNGITLCHAHHPRKRAEEKLLIPDFQRLVGVSQEII